VKTYLTAYPDIQKADIDPFRHFLEFGRSEGRTRFMPTAAPGKQPAKPQPAKPPMHDYAEYFLLKDLTQDKYIASLLEPFQEKK
jgi:hypothetical protein